LQELKDLESEHGKGVMSNLSVPQMKRTLTKRRSTAIELSSTPASAPTPDDDAGHNTPATIRRVFDQYYSLWLQYQQIRIAGCRLFLLPCVVNTRQTVQSDADISSSSMFALKRPAFVTSWFKPLQRAADHYPKRYILVTCLCFGLPSILCSFFLDGTVKGVTTLVFNSATIASFLIFLSGNRYNLDKVAAKHIATSFRFATCAFLLLQIVALDTRKAYLTFTLPSTEIVGERIHFTQAAAVAVFSLIFCTALLLDCVPHLPATAQFVISVSASHPSRQTKQKTKQKRPQKQTF
jgi:hypothetical protein